MKTCCSVPGSHFSQALPSALRPLPPDDFLLHRQHISRHPTQPVRCLTVRYRSVCVAHGGPHHRSASDNLEVVPTRAVWPSIAPLPANPLSFRLVSVACCITVIFVAGPRRFVCWRQCVAACSCSTNANAGAHVGRCGVASIHRLPGGLSRQPHVAVPDAVEGQGEEGCLGSALSLPIHEVFDLKGRSHTYVGQKARDGAFWRRARRISIRVVCACG